MTDTALGHLAPAQDFTAEQINVIRNTIARDCNDAELALFIGACKRSGLDPLQKQIYAMKLGGKLSIQTSIDGFRVIAERSGKYRGQVGPYWCGADGAWKDVWLDAKAPAAAKVGILHRDFAEPLWGVARTASYSKGSGLWLQMPDVMISKVAEALGLRKSFPNDLSGLYTADEMDQAQNGPAPSLKPRTVAEFKAQAKEIADSAPPAAEPVEDSESDLLAMIDELDGEAEARTWQKANAANVNALEPGARARVKAAFFARFPAPDASLPPAVDQDKLLDELTGYLVSLTELATAHGFAFKHKAEIAKLDAKHRDLFALALKAHQEKLRASQGAKPDDKPKRERKAKQAELPAPEPVAAAPSADGLLPGQCAACYGIGTCQPGCPEAS